LTLDASALAAKTIKDYVDYVDSNELDWIDYYPPTPLDFREWQERENPCDPDTDA
jgi:hypothetical protein